MLLSSTIPFYHTCLLEPFASYIGTDVYIHNPDNINNCERATEEVHNYMVLVLQQYGIVLVNIRENKQNKAVHTVSMKALVTKTQIH
jgi:hypothetical protein